MIFLFVCLFCYVTEVAKLRKNDTICNSFKGSLGVNYKTVNVPVIIYFFQQNSNHTVVVLGTAALLYNNGCRNI